MKVKIFEKKLNPTKLFPKGRIALYLDFYHQGKRKFETLNLFIEPEMSKIEKSNIREIAEKIRNERATIFYQNEFSVQLETTLNKDFKDYLEKFVLYKKNKGITFTAYHGVSVKINKFHKGKLTFRMIDSYWIESFFNFLRAEVKSKNTQNAYANKLSAVLNSAVKDKFISSNPMLHIKKPEKVSVQKVYLIESEIKQLIDTPIKHKELKLGFLFSCFTGLRYSDIKKLTWSEIKNNRIEIIQKKTKEPIYLDLSDTAIAILNQKYQLETINNIKPMPNRRVFRLPGNKRNDLLREWAKKACLDEIRWKKTEDSKSHLTFHSARHTYATLAITQGIDLYTVSQLLGHTDIKTTQVYAKIINERRKEELKKLPLFESFA
ncbi:MAG: site-specific integrase [Ignavibacteriae bacterium]|nr:site-specific integrase [Ignavibacteriota bacterium]